MIKFIILELLFREIRNPQFIGRMKYKRKGPIFHEKDQETAIGLVFTNYLIVLQVNGYIRLNLLFWSYCSEKSEIRNL